MPLTNGNVAENGEVSKPLVEGGIEMSNMETAADKRTRFQVNKVNADNKDIQISVEDDDDDRDGADEENLIAGSDRAKLNSDTAHSSDTKYGKSFR